MKSAGIIPGAFLVGHILRRRMLLHHQYLPVCEPSRQQIKTARVLLAAIQDTLEDSDVDIYKSQT